MRGRLGMPPLLEQLGLAELEHNPRNNRMRALTLSRTANTAFMVLNDVGPHDPLPSVAHGATVIVCSQDASQQATAVRGRR
jgi:hypothetical protein